jgi:arginase
VAVKIVRQINKIALIGAPTSAAALLPGHEKAPAALGAAGLAARLEQAGYEVTDFGDDPVATSQPDDENPRARNLPRVVAALEALKPRVELALKSGALPLILGGDCSIALGVAAAMRRYHKTISIIYMDRDADLNTPATSPSGCVDGMVVSHLTGGGAPELVRPWGEPPLVRSPDVALFGVDRADPPEEEALRRTPFRYFPADAVLRDGAAQAARTAIARTHAATNDFLLHLDVDVISSDDFPATTFPAAGGLRWDDVRAALETFAAEPHLGAFEITVYNPDRDPDGACAAKLMDMLASVLAHRLSVLKAAELARAAAKASPPAEGPAPMHGPAAAVRESAPATADLAPASGGDGQPAAALPPAVAAPESVTEPPGSAATAAEEQAPTPQPSPAVEQAPSAVKQPPVDNLSAVESVAPEAATPDSDAAAKQGGESSGDEDLHAEAAKTEPANS